MQHAEQAALSPRQTEIAAMIVLSGKSTREIALELTLSPRTVETHIAAIYNKYGVSSRAELMVALAGPGADARAREMWPAAADAAKTNLPVRRGELVGRAADVETIRDMLRVNQLVTLTGAGGIGKTQAAIAVGEAFLEERLGEVWLLELAALAHGSPVVEALARTLSIQPAKNRTLLDSLIAHLQRKTLLLIVDNCEHVIDQAATLVHALLQSCPRLKVLATSREPLRIAGEQAYRLPSLTVPAREGTAPLSAARGGTYSAIELFVRRAQAVNFAFVLDDENAPIVADICRRVDGIPLAIELSAARVKILSLSVIATKIDSHLRILAGGDRLALPRHRTMHALIDWSYHLLSPAEQRLFERLSVFSGGCTLREATAVYGETDDEFGVLDLLSSLADKSLLTVDPHSSEPRYSLLQSFGQYASEKLQSRAEEAAVRARHAITYTALAERLEDEYDLAPTSAWFSRSESESEKFLSALDWTLKARLDVALGQRLAAAMRSMWMHAGGGESWLRLARQLTDERTPPLLAARLDYALAWAQELSRDYNAALETSLGLIAVLDELGDPRRAAFAQSLAAFSLLLFGRLTEAEPLITSALEVARSHGHATLIAYVLRMGSLLHMLRGEFGPSREKLVEAVAIYERIGAERLATIAINHQAELEFQIGNAELAYELMAKCLNLQRAHRSRHITLSLVNIAAYSVALNRWDQARAYAREALDLAQESEDGVGLIALQHLAAVAVLSSCDDAVSHPSATACAPTSASPAPSASSLETLSKSATILGYVDARAIRVGVARQYTEQQEYDRVFAALRALVPNEKISEYLARGATLTADQALELVLSI